MKKLFKRMSVSILGMSVLVGCGSTNIKLQNEIFIVELGQQISTKVEAYLSKDTDKDVLKKASIKFDLNEAYSIDQKKNVLKPTKNKYIPVGKYKAIASYEKKEKAFTVEVKDTTAPKFIGFKDEVVIEANAENVDITNYYKAGDLSEVNILIEKGTLDLTKEGMYKIKVTAIDKYKNKETKKAVVKIVSLKSAKEDGVTETINGEKPISKKLQEILIKEKEEQEQAKKLEEIKQEEQETLVEQTNPDTNNSGSASSSIQEETNTIGNIISASAQSYVGNSGSHPYTAWTCVDTVSKALVSAGVDDAAFFNVYENRGNGGYEVETLQPGDIVMYYSSSGIYHCAVYIGNGMAVHGGFHSNGNTNERNFVVAIAGYNVDAASTVKFFRFW